MKICGFFCFFSVEKLLNPLSPRKITEIFCNFVTKRKTTLYFLYIFFIFNKIEKKKEGYKIGYNLVTKKLQFFFASKTVTLNFRKNCSVTIFFSRLQFCKK